jgi:2-keto-4-pentenoate hydratase/2-oxohepta-3-ene-1,7-dioic acid hydratase in catechol pathway
MKIVRFTDGTRAVAHGVVRGDHVLRIEEAPVGGVEDWLALGAGTVEEIAARALQSNRSVPLAALRLLAPIQRPRKFLGLGGNYASHLREIEHLGIKSPEMQVWFNKQNSCIAGPFDDVVIPVQSDRVDYEGELAVVIGRRCRNVPAERAREIIAGYMVCNDVSVRDVQLRSPTMTLGKSFDTHGPTGPWLVTADEIPDPQRLAIRTWVNGELRQDGNTSEMRHTIFDQIAELSSVFTLEPGDILATGTPAGVAAAMRPPRYLRAGDVVRIEIEQIGVIENRFIVDSGRILIE